MATAGPRWRVTVGWETPESDLPEWATESDADRVPTGPAMDYVAVNSIDAIDACSFHTYPDSFHGHWGLTPAETKLGPESGT